jgi:hypothetical protein
MPIEACYDPFTAQPTLQCFTERLCKVVVTHTHISAKTLSRQEVTVFLVDSISSGFFHSESSHILLCTPFWCLWREALQLLLHCRLAFVATPGARGARSEDAHNQKKNTFSEAVSHCKWWKGVAAKKFLKRGICMAINLTVIVRFLCN